MTRLYRVILPVSDIERAALFYGQVLGMPGQRVSPGRHYFRVGETILACYDPLTDGDTDAPRANFGHLYFAVSDLEATFDRARSARASGLEGGIARMPWGEHLFYAQDPFGNPICFVDESTVFTRLGIKTERLELIAGTLEMARAETAGGAQLSRLLGAEAPERTPREPAEAASRELNLRRLEEDPARSGWWRWYFVRRAAGDAKLVGVGGFKGPPDAEGTVDIGFLIFPEHRNAGYATEAARGLVEHAFGFPRVERVVAETLPGAAPSIRVLEKVGFVAAGGGPAEGVLRFVLGRQAPSPDRRT